MLTELLSHQKLLIEKVVYETSHIAEIGLISKSEYTKQLNENRTSINKNIEKVDKLFESSKNRLYTLDEKPVEMKFRDEFAVKFDKVLSNALNEWKNSKEKINYLLNSKNLENTQKYNNMYNSFIETNKQLIIKSNEIIKICRDEAKAKEVLSKNIQYASIFVSLIIFIILLKLIFENFYKPIKNIQKVFKKMSKGIFNQKFKRDKDDEFKVLYNNFNHFIDNLNFIFKLEDKILNENNLEKIMLYISENFKKFIPFKTLEIEYINQNNELINMVFNDKKCIKNTTKNMDNSYEKFKDLKIKENSIVSPIYINETFLGKIVFNFEKNKKIDPSYKNFLYLIKDKLSLAIYKSLLFNDLLNIITNTLSQMSEYKDPETGKHLIRMGKYSKIIAKELQSFDKYKDVITNDFINQIEIAAPMHDIGKVGIPDKILLKPAKLTDDEFNVIKTHPTIGANILKELHEKFNSYNINYFEMPYLIALGHHEKINGKGYPNNLKKDEINICAKIAALGDIFDALTSKRPYKEAFSLEKSYKIIKDMSNDHLDPDIVKAFFNQKEAIEKVYNDYKE